MKNRLSNADYRQVFSCIEAIHRCRSLEDFPLSVLAELRKLVPCTLAGYNEVNLPRNRILAVVDRPQPHFGPLLLEFQKLMHEHPVITYFDRTGDGQALKISDFMGARAYHRLAIYRKVYQPMAVEDQLAIAVRVDPGFMIGLAFARDRRSFTERDRLCLNLVRPHLIQSYLHAAELASHQEQHLDWQAALRENGLGVVAMDHAGKVLQATPDALECLGRFLPGSPSGPSSLPGRLVQWANSPADPAPFILSRDAARLIVRRVAHGPRIVLLVSEEGGPDDGGRLDRFHLTPREREVLRWIADGKSNAGIAVILRLSVGTVKLHVGRILAKLGVENRTAAALLARENRP